MSFMDFKPKFIAREASQQTMLPYQNGFSHYQWQAGDQQANLSTQKMNRIQRALQIWIISQVSDHLHLRQLCQVILSP